MKLVGLLLAAGAGGRTGQPKALLRDDHDVPFLDRAIGVLFDGGCERVTVVLGASADDARALLDEAGWTDDAAVEVVVATEWQEGMGASLRSGLAALDATSEAALVTLVDQPDLSEAVLRRVTAAGVASGSLARATYDGRPGHPVLLGRDHWAGVTSSARGGQGARDYLADHEHVICECGDLTTGRDVDHAT